MSQGNGGEKTTDKLEPDEMFEAFLASRTQSKTVILLARASFYGETIFRILWPIDAAAPPDIVALTPQGPTGPVGPVSLRYRLEDIKAAGAIANSFDSENPGRSGQYRKMLLQFQTRVTGP